jgi:hypothetical protein
MLSRSQYRATIIDNGQVDWKCESEVEYDEAGNILVGYDLQSYFNDGRLDRQEGVAALTKDGVLNVYSIAYDITNGVVFYTHILDEDGNEISGVDGFVHPADVLAQLEAGTGEMKKSTEDRIEAQNNEEADRMDVKNAVLKWFKDNRFSRDRAEEEGGATDPNAGSSQPAE